MDDGHQHGRGGSLATDIANAEEQLLVATEVVVDVAAHLAGRLQEPFYLKVLEMGIALRQHALLYLTGHLQLAVDALLLGIDFLQAPQVVRGTPDNDAGKDQTENQRQQHHHTHETQSAKDLAVVQDIDEHPVGIAAHRGVEHMVLDAVLRLQHKVVAQVVVFLQQLQDFF